MILFVQIYLNLCDYSMFTVETLTLTVKHNLFETYLFKKY